MIDDIEIHSLHLFQPELMSLLAKIDLMKAFCEVETVIISSQTSPNCLYCFFSIGRPEEERQAR